MSSTPAAEALSRIADASNNLRESWSHTGPALTAATGNLRRFGNHLAEARQRDLDEWIKTNPHRRYWVRIN